MTVEVFEPITNKQVLAIRIQEIIDSDRYTWLRENPCFASEMELMKLTPEQFDALVDKHRAWSADNV